ncbi:hydroxyacid dehydrogenase [Aestuariivirga sp.]|uniref:hydroxyacid dehydrogenase n=1 Tax=Aestuariivirga sp. TaxID=2650926 RepID=UPI0039E4852D
MPHVLIAGKIHQAGLDVLDHAQGLTWEMVPEVSLASYAPLAPKADAILIRTQPMTAEVIASAPRLQIVSRHGVGYDAVDVAALTARKIPLCIVGDVNSRAVAEHTLMLMLAAARRTVAHDHAARCGNWNERNQFNAGELDGKTLLILGFGRIGRRVAELAQAFGMTVAVYDPFVAAETVTALNCTPAVDLLSALAQADYVSLHLPATRAPVIGAKELAAMKPTAILVNAARGELVDEKALDVALRDGHLRHAALDVLAQEPPPADHPLLANANVTISPHNAGLTEECAARMAISSAQNILDHFAGTLDRRLVVNA